jgi:alkanesulfonate monooxygenase SsuD/methylene tetrahydromethanopterin reductase-like flavin-dependent oxidoreductase (luciferase family)
VNVMFMLSVDAGAERRMREQLDAQWGERAAQLADGALVGTPEQAVEKILAYRQAGAGGLNIALRAPWDEEALSAYLEIVVPAVRRELATSSAR